MNRITLLEWCTDPLNRIKLMEDLLFVFQTEFNRQRPTWQFCCPTIAQLVINNPNYSHIEVCRILAIYGESPGAKDYVYLHDILPELLRYKDQDNGLAWFRSYTKRLKALEAAIQDIKNNL